MRWQDVMPKWSNPPTAKQTKEFFGQTLIRDYITLFEKRVKRQPNFAQLSLHVIVGQLPAIKKIRIHVGANELDLRISGCFFKPSGSGGGRGFNFTAQVAKELDVKYQVVTEITDAALIGSSDESKEYDPTKKGMVIKNIVKRGALDPTIDDNEPNRPIANIVAMNEADILFSAVSSEFKKNAMLYYQIALNTMGTEDNKLAKKLAHGDWIEFYPNCSLLLMSYPPDSFFETIIKRGFLQRMIILFNLFSTQDRIDVAKELTSLLESGMDDSTELFGLIRRLAYVNEYWAGKEKVVVKVEPEAMKILVRLVDEFFLQFEGIAEYPRKKLEEFSQRWIEHTWRIAWHHMLMRLDDTIKLEDVGYAKNYILPIWKQLIGLLEEGITPPKDHDRLWKAMTTEAIRLYNSIIKKRGLKSGSVIPRADFIRKLSNSDYWGVSPKTASQRVRKMEDEDLFERAYEGTAPMVRLKKLPKWMKKLDEVQ